jgi:intermembrane space import and assembly protein 40
MQDCFRQHPEMYGSELEDDEDEVEEDLRAREGAQASGEAKDAPSAQSPESSSPEAHQQAAPQPSEKKENAPAVHRDSRHTEPGTAQPAGDEGEELVPKAVHDATSK